MQYAKYPALLALTILVASCAGVTSRQGKIHSAISAINKQQSEAINRGDAASVAALYSSDAQILPPNEELVTGRPAILKFWQTSLSGGQGTVTTITSKESESCGDTAWEVGTYMVKGADGKVLDKGKYITIWKHENGQWKLHRDTFNSDLPATKQ